MFNKLCKAAAHFKLESPRLDGKPSEMRQATNKWIELIQVFLCTNNKTNGLLDDHPDFPKDIPPIINEALGSFLHAKMSHQIKSMLGGVLNTKDGVGILKRVQATYATASLKDRGRTHLGELQMPPKDTISSFIRKF